MTKIKYDCKSKFGTNGIIGIIDIYPINYDDIYKDCLTMPVATTIVNPKNLLMVAVLIGVLKSKVFNDNSFADKLSDMVKDTINNFKKADLLFSSEENIKNITFNVLSNELLEKVETFINK